MFWIVMAAILFLAGWLTYDMTKQDHNPPIENDEWDDNKNHTEGDFN